MWASVAELHVLSLTHVNRSYYDEIIMNKDKYKRKVKAPPSWAWVAWSLLDYGAGTSKVIMFAIQTLGFDAV